FHAEARLRGLTVTGVQTCALPICSARARRSCGPAIFPGLVTKLFRNRGRTGDGRVRFEDVTVKAGLTKAAPGLGVYCADFDGDEIGRAWVGKGCGGGVGWCGEREM